MAGSLPYGNDVLGLMKSLPPKDKTIIVVRHSERPSFDNIPMNRWNTVGLTSRGVEAAKGFGRKLARDLGGTGLRVYGRGLPRVIDTAAAVAEGAKSDGGRVVEQRAIRLRSPITNRSAYQEAQQSGQWLEVVKEWLGGAAETPMVAIHEYDPRSSGPSSTLPSPCPVKPPWW